MSEVRRRALVGECISRTSVEAARGATLADIEQAIAACDHERAATLAFARARASEPVPTELIARILPGIELPAITCSLIAITPERAALLDAVVSRRFPQTKDAGDLEALTLYAAWKAGADPAQVIAPLRRLAARSLTAEGYALLATIAAAIDDPNVAAATRPISSFAKQHAKNVASDHKAMTATIDAVIAELPSEVDAAVAAGFTVRGGKQPGRNDPCPCGSGLKYKKCCADRPAATPSPVPGLAWEEFLGDKADQITVAHVDELALKDLVRVDPSRLAEPTLLAAHERMLTAHEWAHAGRLLAELERRGGDGVDDARDLHVSHLLAVSRLEEARPLIARMPPDLARAFALDLELAEGGARAYRALVDAAREAITSSEKLPGIDLAYSLLRGEPALGVLAARACIGAMQVDDPDMLLEAVEEVRDLLNLPPTDPAWNVLDTLTERDPRPSSGHDADQLRRALAESTARVDQLERALAATRAELDAARTLPPAELVRAPEAESGLEAKVRELEAVIREGNAERLALRRQLATRDTSDPPERKGGPRPRRAALDEPDLDFEEPELVPGSRGVTIPRFDRRATDAFAEVPTTVAAEALRTLGTLAAGDGFAWRGVKQAKDMARQVLMARVGIHHRLIFRCEAGELDVLDLVTREQLLTTLKRLRANR